MSEERLRNCARWPRLALDGEQFIGRLRTGSHEFDDVDHGECDSRILTSMTVIVIATPKATIRCTKNMKRRAVAC